MVVIITVWDFGMGCYSMDTKQALDVVVSAMKEERDFSLHYLQLYVTKMAIDK